MKTEKTSSEFKASGAPIDEGGAPCARWEGSEAQISDGNPEETQVSGVCPEKSETSSARTEESEAQISDGNPEEKQSVDRGFGTFVSPANVLTSMRIALSGILLLLKPLRMTFYCIYALAGLTDMLDGPLARKTETESRVGAVLDSAADLVFVTVACVKLLPVYWVQIPTWLLISTAFVFYLKVKNAIACFAMYKKLIAMHTVMNRLAGILLFAFPFACIMLPIPVYGGICAAAAFAATVDAFVKMVTKTF